MQKSSKKNVYLAQRRTPTQERSHARTQKILEVTAKLLENHGIEGLTTAMIAKELKMSVGSLYHYFPNKHAILNVLATTWLAEMTLVLDQVSSTQTQDIPFAQLIDDILEGIYQVYRRQEAVLPLAQALSSIPELRHLDAEHDRLIITKMIKIFRNAGFVSTDNELNRIARVFLELTHSLLIVAVDQRPVRSARTMADVKMMAIGMLEHHKDDTKPETRPVEAP